MPHIKFTNIAMDDINRITQFMDEIAPEVTDTMLENLLTSIDQLKTFPLIAKSSPEEKYKHLRELFIPFGANGYAVLYEYREDLDFIIIASIKHTKEQGFSI